MAGKSSFYDSLIGSLDENVREEQARIMMEAREKAKAVAERRKKMSSKFNTARVHVYMRIAPTVFEALGVKLPTSLDDALSREGMREKLQNASDFEDIFEADVKLLAEIAAFLRSREDISSQIRSFADKYRAEHAAVASVGTVGSVGSVGSEGAEVCAAAEAGDDKDEYQGGF